MSNGNLGNIDKLYKKRIKPATGEKDALYFIGDSNSDYIDFYVTDRNGDLIPIIDPNRFQTSREILQYESDINPGDNNYYYGYLFNSYWKIIRVQKDNVVTTSKAESSNTNIFQSSWNNRENLIYT